jgi:lipopolysaccharide transport system ATP-binding protein
MDSVIIFDRVSKTYPLYHHFTGSIKNLLFHLPNGIDAIRNSRYEALHNISFEIGRGETFGIIGKNGAGKSTILGLIAGVLRPTTGTIRVFDRVSPLLELGAGFHPELTGRENITLKGVLIGLSRAEVQNKMEEIINFSELGEFIDQPTRIYSSGMLARLGFSIVASLDPEILLIDEILAVGDAEFQKKCLKRMEDFKSRGVTIVLVSHSQDQVKRICDKVLWIENHKIRAIGISQDILP